MGRTQGDATIVTRENKYNVKRFLVTENSVTKVKDESILLSVYSADYNRTEQNRIGYYRERSSPSSYYTTAAWLATLGKTEDTEHMCH